MNYFIFSDESGSWGNRKDPFYVRSWIKIREDDFYRLVGIWETHKLPYPTKESLLKNSQGINEKLEKENFIYFFTFTKMDEFYLRKINIKDKIMEQVNRVILQLEHVLKTYMKNQIPIKVKNAIDYVLFLNMYESYHLKNAIEKLYSSDEKVTLVIDKPKFSEDDYLKIFEDIKKDRSISLLFSHKKDKADYTTKYKLGISIADSLVSMCCNLLKDEDKDNLILDYFKKYILGKSLAGNIGLVGFNKVFYPVNQSYGNEKLITEERNLIRTLSKKLNHI
jgi:hypothetical protein